MDSQPRQWTAQVRTAGGPVEPQAPGPGEVRVDVLAAGICGADAGTVTNPKPANGFPITPGHEVAGVVHRSLRQVTPCPR